MDLRVKKTEQAIKNAFLELRSQKPLEKIRITEMCERACINKSTFYDHYQDIYALSDAIETEVVENIMAGLSIQNPVDGKVEEFTRELTYAFVAQSRLINMLFSGSRQSHLSTRIEERMKERVFESHPELRNDLYWNVLLSYCIQGAYGAFQSNRDSDISEVIAIIGSITGKIQPQYDKINEEISL